MFDTSPDALTPSPSPIRLAAQALAQRVGEGSAGLSPFDPPSSDYGATRAEGEVN